MNIGIDIDDTIVEYMKGYLEFYNKKKGTNFILDDVFSYSQVEVMKIPGEEAKQLIFEFGESEKFMDLDFFPGAKDSISSLENGEHKIFFITSRPEREREKTKKFLEKNFPKNNFELHLSGERWGKLKSKGEICEELCVEVMVEDNEHYALDCAKRGIKTFLVDRPWNKEYEKHENIIRVENWEEIMEVLNKFIYGEKDAN
jgi:uncharacterized HAD superfamily protein